MLPTLGNVFVLQRNKCWNLLYQECVAKGPTLCRLFSGFSNTFSRIQIRTSWMFSRNALNIHDNDQLYCGIISINLVIREAKDILIRGVIKALRLRAIQSLAFASL